MCYTVSQNLTNASMAANVPSPSAIIPSTNIVSLCHSAIRLVPNVNRLDALAARVEAATSGDTNRSGARART